MKDRADVVVCGAGIAGVASAFHLAVEIGMPNVVLVDPRPPLSLTSDKSTECYRNWWPNRPMVALMNRSIDLLEGYAEQSGNAFHMNRRGYLYVTADRLRLAHLGESAALTAGLGAGDLRLHSSSTDGYLPAPSGGFHDQPIGGDLFTDGISLLRHFPYLTDRVVGGLHIRRAGWFSAQQLGSWMLSRSIAAGMKLVRAEVVGVGVAAGRISSVRLDNGAEIITTSFVNAAGPMLARVARLVGVDLPVWSEAHDKLVFRDSIGAIPREAPMIIWADPQRLTWSSEEAHLLSEDGRRDLLEEMPAQCHGRPEGGTDSPWFVALWEYQHRVLDPVWPMPEDPLFPEVVMRGLTTMVPGLSPYLQHLPQPFVDGGYYTKTADNRPLAGPMGVEGAYVAGALSGYGVMAAAAVAELVGAHITGSRLPDYATSFSLERISDPEYVRELATLIDTGQL